MWKNNRRRFSEKFSTWDVIRKYNKDYKLIFVGDATMSPYEILQPGGSVEYNNEEPGAEWLQRLTHAFPKFAWINPEPQGVWQYRQSIAVVQQIDEPAHVPAHLAGPGRGHAAAQQMSLSRSAAPGAVVPAAVGTCRLCQPAVPDPFVAGHAGRAEAAAAVPAGRGRACRSECPAAAGTWTWHGCSTPPRPMR